MKAVAVLMLLVTAVSAQPRSFRSLSTSGLLLDDLDLWLGGMLGTQPVPDALAGIEGHRVYTGLANLDDGFDRALDERSEGEGGFVLGGSAALPGSSAGLGVLGRFLDGRTFEDITLAGPGGEMFTGEGTVEASWSVFTDTNGDGTYDTRHTEHASASGWSDSSATEAGLFGAWQPGSFRIGIGLAYIVNSVSVEPASLNFTRTVTDTNLVTGAATYLEDAAGDGIEKDDTSGILAALSGSGTLGGGVSATGMFLFRMISGTHEESSSESGVEDWMPGEPLAQDALTWDSMEEFSVDVSGSTLGGGAVLGWDLGPGWRLEVGGSAHMTSVTGDSPGFLTAVDSLYQFSAGSLLEVTSTSIDGSGSLSLEHELDDIRGGAKISADLGGGLLASAGLFVDRESESTTGTADISVTGVQTFSDGDSQPFDPDDYTATSNWSENYREMETRTLTSIGIPVGLEFPVVPRVVARLGAAPALVWEEETLTTTLISASPAQTTVVYGDGTVEQFAESPWTVQDNTLVSTDDSRTEIPFSYGLGFAPTENLQLDFMGVSSDMTEWRISATLKL